MDSDMCPFYHPDRDSSERLLIVLLSIKHKHKGHLISPL
jgi:hypothetical protein